MKKLSRKIYNECIADAKKRKALALLVFCKCKIKSSTITNFSYNKLKSETGLHISTLKKRVQTLREMGFIKMLGNRNQHLMFCNVRSNNSNVLIDRIISDTVKTVEDGLLAMFIVEVQLKKNYVSQLVAKLKNPKNLEEYKWAKRICKWRGYTKFIDNGISYNYIANKLGIQLNKVSDIIKYAVKQLMIIKTKRWKVEFHFDSSRQADHFLSFIDNVKKGIFSHKGYIYRVGANLYSIPSEWEAGMAHY